MKKGILICAALLFLAFLVAAPVTAATQFKFGLKAGASFANVKWTDDDGTENTLVRPTFGALALIELSPTLALQPEVNYLVMGESWETLEEDIIEEFTYLHIPVLIRARLMKEGKFVPVVFAGPAVGFLLSAKEAGVDVKSFYKSTDFGADFGVGAEIALSKMKALIDLRYYLGLTNAFSAPPILAMAAAPIEFRMKNAGFVVTAGLIF